MQRNSESKTGKCIFVSKNVRYKGMFLGALPYTLHFSYILGKTCCSKVTK